MENATNHSKVDHPLSSQETANKFRSNKVSHNSTTRHSREGPYVLLFTYFYKKTTFYFSLFTKIWSWKCGRKNFTSVHQLMKSVGLYGMNVASPLLKPFPKLFNSLFNLTAGLEQLIFEGLTVNFSDNEAITISANVILQRELPVFGITHGQVVSGIIVSILAPRE